MVFSGLRSNVLPSGRDFSAKTMVFSGSAAPVSWAGGSFGGAPAYARFTPINWSSFSGSSRKVFASELNTA
jgi:hypothetical protein